MTYYNARSFGTISGIASVSYYSSTNKLLWVFSVHGTFNYDGKTATATSATYSYSIYDTAWSFKSGRAYCSGNQAIAEGTFSGGIFLTRSASAILSCFPNGVLS